MTNYDPPCKTLFFVCYSTVAAIVATEAGLLGNSDAHSAELSHKAHQEFIEEFERYFASNEEHPWCGTGRMDDAEVRYLIPQGDAGVHFINEEEYEKQLAEGLQEA